jgi:hypothetical protein
MGLADEARSAPLIRNSAGTALAAAMPARRKTALPRIWACV